LITTMQLVVLITASIARGASFDASGRLAWFVAGAALLIVVTCGIAEVLATRLTSAEEYTGALPAIAIVPFFFAGSLYPITSLPAWLADVAKVLPLTHALALFRFGLTAGGGQACTTSGAGQRHPDGGPLSRRPRSLRPGDHRRRHPAVRQGEHQVKGPR
jgi:ABC-type polysaccharide/polyol phosphate export permease